MANIRYFNITDCSNGNGYGLYIDDTSSELIVGNTYLFSGLTNSGLKRIPYGCYTITGEKKTDQTTPNGVLLNSYGIDGCQTCLDNNSNALLFEECSGNFGSVYFQSTDFSPIPNINDTFFLDFYLSGGGEPQRITGCFTLKNKELSDPGFYRFASLFSATTQTGCEECLSNSSVLYYVYDCLSDDEYIIALPNNTYDGHLITFTDLGGITQFCGTINGVVNGISSITGLIVSDLGIPGETGVFCGDCLSNVAEKKKLINCLDGHVDYVWASTLFSVGDATNLTTGQGCYEISPDVVPPETEITYNELADFDPHNNCEDCIECYGVTYQFTTCNEIEVKGLTNQLYLQSYGAYSVSYDNINDKAYVVNTYGNNVTKIDMSTYSVSSVIGPGGTGLSNPTSSDINPNNQLLVVVNNNNTYTVLNTLTSNTFTYNNPLGVSGQAMSVYYNPNNGYFYIGWRNYSTGIDFVSVHNITAYNTNTIITTFNLSGQYPSSIIEVGGNLYISCYYSNIVLVVNSTTYSTVNTIYTFNVFNMSYDGSNLIYMAGGSTNYGIYDISVNSLSYYSPGFGSCCCEKNILVDSPNNKLYVTDYCENAIYIIDTLTNTIIDKYNNNNGNVSQVRDLINISGSIYFVGYDYIYNVTKSLQFVSDSIDSYEYIPTGNIFFHPVLNTCCEVTSVDSSLSGSYTFYSLLSYDNCTDCDNVSHEMFYCEECNDGDSGLLVAPTGTYSVGDFIKSHWGNSDWLCFEILDTWTQTNYGNPSIIFEGENMTSYSSCTECQSGATVGITVINCDTLVPSNVTVTLQEWLQISGLFSVSNRTISDNSGQCYTVINTCPVDNVYPPFEISEYFLNETQCRINAPQTISAGTETIVCVIDCSGNTISVVPPHPTWTNSKGNDIVLLDAIAMGGINGLNS